MSTNLSFLNFDDDDDYTSSSFDPVASDTTDSNELCLMLSDCSISQENRSSLITELQNSNPLQLSDIINEMCSSYTENQTSSLAECLSQITTIVVLPVALRIKCAMTLDNSTAICNIVAQCLESDEQLASERSNGEERTNGEERGEMNHTLCFTSVTSCIWDVPHLAIPILEKICSKKSLDGPYRYKLLLHVIDNPTDVAKVELIRACLYSINEPKYIVFTAQLATKYKCLTFADCEYLLSLTLSDDKAKSDLAAAEICDFLLGCEIVSGSCDFIEKVKARLMNITGSDVIQLFKSNQTVHQVSSDIEGFVKDLMNYNPTPFAIVVLYLRGMYNYNSAVEQAIHRFSLDVGLYSSMACSLSNILCRVFTKIQSHSMKDLLMQRLSEECADMSDTCSSGHLVRLINVFSGIDGGITLSIKDEINSVMQHRISKLISRQPVDIQEAIIEELEKDQQDVIQKYLYKEMAILHDIMKEEYAGLVSDSTFTEYFRNSILYYTCIKQV